MNSCEKKISPKTSKSFDLGLINLIGVLCNSLRLIRLFTLIALTFGSYWYCANVIRFMDG